MFLQSLTIKNIRSYQEQTINFQENSTLLSGDIGCGKSTLLLAIEFALFGISKPDLTGETLLRKGTTQASVELQFQLNNQTIKIQRNLKKTSIAIQQTAGFIEINKVRKDLTPIELKTQIISLLNYPEDTITKSKNYLFRYTLYCPQEEMKFILQDSPENRLDLLRKIFQLDKYKTIRENLWNYLKQLRIKSTILKTKLEPLEQKKTELNYQRKQQTLLTQEFKLLQPKLETTQLQIQNHKTYLASQEKQQQLHQQLQNQLQNSQNLQQQLHLQQTQLTTKQTQLNEQLQTITILQSQESIQNTIQTLQSQQQEFLSQKSTFQTKIDHCQEQARTLQQEISQLTQQLSQFHTKQTEIQTLQQTIQTKPQLQKKQQYFEKQLDKIKQQLQQQKLLITQAQEIQSQIQNLDHCPTCLQDISEKHQKQVLQKQQIQIQTSQTYIKEFTINRSKLQKEFLEINQQLDSLIQQENRLIRLQTELHNLQEKQTQLTIKKQLFQETIQQNNQLMKELEKLQPQQLIHLNRQLQTQQNLLQQHFQKQELKKNLQETTKILQENQTHLTKLQTETQQIETQLQQTPDLTETIQQEKTKLEQAQEQEKSLLTEKTKIQTRTEHIQQQIQTLIQEINQLNQYHSHLIHITELNHWLDEFLIKLTYTIEKQLLIKIHQLFNQLFQEWFEILVEDTNFSARLDDSFTPVIEQNGYEIFFNNLSGGERTAASLSYRLALNKVINDIIQNINTKDLLILDEPTDGFSSEQLDKIRDVLDKLNLKQTLIVSHESKIESFVDNIIRIHKQEGISQIM